MAMVATMLVMMEVTVIVTILPRHQFDYDFNFEGLADRLGNRAASAALWYFVRANHNYNC